MKANRPDLFGIPLVVLSAILLAWRAEAQSTGRVSLTSQGTEANEHSDAPSISANGRFVAFSSAASDLVPGDTNGNVDIFVRDRLLGTTIRVSVDSQGAQGATLSRDPAISANGRFVAFDSLSNNLVPGDTNDLFDVFVYELSTGITRRVSVDSQGNQSNGNCSVNSLSETGRFVVFSTLATNLVPGDTNGVYDVFVHDRDADENGIFDESGSIQTVRVSVASDGNESDGSSFPGNGGSACQSSISASGRFVAFYSYASNLVPDDQNGGVADVFVHDRDANGNGLYDEPGMISTVLVSVNSQGTHTAFYSLYPSISGNGRFVSFTSGAPYILDPRKTDFTADIFVHDRDTNGNGVFDEPGGISTALVSANSNGIDGNAPTGYGSRYSAISADGRFVTFSSEANNLVPGDTNGNYDVFLHDRQTKATTRVSVGWQESQSSGDTLEHAQLPSISANGRFVAFASEATNILSAGEDTNNVTDVFVRDNAERWDRQSLLPAPGRVGAVGATINDRGYVLGGVNSPVYVGNFLWEYTPGVPDKWRRRATFPGIWRSDAVAFAIGSKLYVGTGRIQNTTYALNDFWEWDQASNIWTQRASLPANGRYGAVALAINGKGYVGGGQGPGPLKEFWEYTSNGSAGSWTRVADIPGPGRVDATGFAIGGSGFVGMGVGLSDLWEYVPGGAGTWLPRASLPGGPRSLAVGFSLGDRGYVGTGVVGGKSRKDFWEYTPGSPGVWIKKKDFAGVARRGAVGFSIDGKGYIGTGEGFVSSSLAPNSHLAQGTLLQSDFWKYTP